MIEKFDVPSPWGTVRVMGSLILSIKEEQTQFPSLREQDIKRVVLEQGGFKHEQLKRKTKDIKDTLIAVLKNIKNQILFQDQQITVLSNNQSPPHNDVVTNIQTMQERIRDLENSVSNVKTQKKRLLSFLI